MIAIRERAVVRVELVFEDKADRQAVAEVFRALKAETRAGLLAGLHFEFVNSIITGGGSVAIKMRITQTRINDTVKLNVSSESGTGESTENGNCSQSLFHDFYLLVLLRPASKKFFCKNRRAGT